ncbi:MAG: ABC transporter substrate-binding protein [Rhodospirillaceae bacterium]|nr:ABC transporter substrate-binding protein [Rhodospirillaceae bacterium]
MFRVLAVAAALVFGGGARAEPTATVRVAVPVPAGTYGNPFARDDGTSTRAALFDGLTSFTRRGKLEPALAKSWAMSAPDTWVFELRDDVAFQNGAPFTAEAVVAAVQFLQTEAGTALDAAREVKTIAGIRAASPHRVEIVTRGPDPILPNRMANIVIPEPKAWAALGVDGFTLAPVGTGPYRPADWGRTTGRIRLVAVPGAWRAPSSVRDVELAILTDSTTRLQALLSGQVDIAVNLEADQVETVTAAGFQVQVLPAPHILGLLLRTEGTGVAPQLKDARVRRALNLAVDKRAIAETVLGGRGVIASQVATSDVFGFDPTLAPYAYDPAAAKQLLAEAGYAKGFALTFGVFSGQVPGDTLMFQVVQQNLAAVGVKATLRMLPFADFMQRLATGSWGGINAFSTTLSSARYGDARQPLEFLSCKAAVPVFCAPELTAALEASNVELDVERRRALLQGALRLAHDLAPALLLTEYASITALAPGVKNYVARANGVLFEQLEIED